MILLSFTLQTNQLQSDKYHYLYRFILMKLYNKSKVYIKNKYIIHLQTNIAVFFKLFIWGAQVGLGGRMSKMKKEGHRVRVLFCTPRQIK